MLLLGRNPNILPNNKKEVLTVFTLEFKTGNAAFKDGESFEVCRILKEVSRKIDDGIIEGSIFDINGNKIGKFKLT